MSDISETLTNSGHKVEIGLIEAASTSFREKHFRVFKASTAAVEDLPVTVQLENSLDSVIAL